MPHQFPIISHQDLRNCEGVQTSLTRRGRGRREAERVGYRRFSPYRMGFRAARARSTPADANESREWSLLATHRLARIRDGSKFTRGICFRNKGI